MLGCVIYELCMLKCSFPETLPVETVQKELTSSYEALPLTFSEDLRRQVSDTLQADKACRPSVSGILTRPFIINNLRETSKPTITTLYRILEDLRALANDLERVHFNTTVGSLTGAVDVFFVFLDSREIHNLRQDYASRESRRESGSTDQTSNNSDTTNLVPSTTQQAEELKSETMKFVKKIKETTEELQNNLDTIRDETHYSRQ
ncbi:hypothetical protein E1301_Tti015537 [Triplophysa tibetana]|uniref:non-specific serine/threonine protein kinase n=1 Tax=Triplophysa tibetana TaxID=1572043 RepID=A0A5A9N4Z3_9TELE|nr:hypothetical protein E1301_Tti015537 [Triplophysa tibetana]